MSVATVIAALQTRHAALTGIAKATTAVPASLAVADLPCAITLPGAGTWVARRLGKIEQEREYIVQVYVAPIVQGIGIDTGFATTVGLLETFGNSYANDRSAGTGYGIYGSFTDSGHQILIWGSEQVAYHGFTFRLQVREVGA